MAMTPKQKCDSLVEDMLWEQRRLDGFANRKVAIECALIAVEEVLSVINIHSMEDENAYKYWQEVKNGLLKLK